MREADVLSRDVRELIRSYIPTPMHLEVLVALAREPGRSWTAQEVAGAKFVDVTAVERALRELTEAGLVQVEGTADAPRFRLGELDAGRRRTIELLIVGYDRMPVQVVRAVYERPPEAVQSFADAFRLQKPK